MFPTRFECTLEMDDGEVSLLLALALAQIGILHSFRVWLYIFSALFECGFTYSPLFSSVALHILHSFRVQLYIFSTRFECSFASSPLVSSVALHILHSFRVQLYIFSTRFECTIKGRPKDALKTLLASDYSGTIKLFVKGRTTLEMSGEDVKLHSKRVEKMSRYCNLPIRRFSYRLAINKCFHTVYR